MPKVVSQSFGSKFSGMVEEILPADDPQSEKSACGNAPGGPGRLSASVIIPCRNGGLTLSQQLDALASQDFQGYFEVIYVDNGSTDDSIEVASKYRGSFASFLILDASEIKGAGQARNVGVTYASSDRILFCDADDVAGPGWVSAMVSALEHASLVGSARDFIRLNPPWHPVVKRKAGEADVQYFGKARIPSVGAASIGIRRTLFEQLGGFDQKLPIHEDADLCLRAHELGITIHVSQEAIMHMRVRAECRPVFRQAWSWGYWHVAFSKKHRALLGRPAFIKPILGWLGLIVSLVSIRGSGDAVTFVYSLGWKCGSFYGSLKTGYLCL